jgi:hypothetical protein
VSVSPFAIAHRPEVADVALLARAFRDRCAALGRLDQREASALALDRDGFRAHTLFREDPEIAEETGHVRCPLDRSGKLHHVEGALLEDVDRGHVDFLSSCGRRPLSGR